MFHFIMERGDKKQNSIRRCHLSGRINFTHLAHKEGCSKKNLSKMYWLKLHGWKMVILSCFMVSIVATIMSLRNSTRNLHVYKACRQPKLISLSVHLTSLVCRIFLSFWPRVPLHKVVYIDLDPSFWDKVQASISKSFISLIA